MREIELKYLVAPGVPVNKVRKQIRSALREAGFRVVESPSQTVVDTYYDTADQQLQHGHWALRYRQTVVPYTLTLKSVSSDAELFSRREYEQEVQRPDASPAELILPEYGAVADTLHGAGLAGQRFTAVFAHSNRRRRFRVTHAAHPGIEVEWSVDRVRVLTGNVAYTEFEFELCAGNGKQPHGGKKRGSKQRKKMLRRLMAVLRSSRSLVPSRMNKSTRGRYAPVPLSALAADSVAVQENWPALGAGSLALLRSQMSACEPYAWESVDPEGVHQMRVVCRKIDAWIRLFGSSSGLDGCAKEVARLRKCSRRLGRALGRVRDIDVHQLQLMTQLSGSDKALQRYRAYLVEQHLYQHGQLRSTLSDKVPELLNTARVLEAQLNGRRHKGAPQILEPLLGAIHPALHEALDIGGQQGLVHNPAMLHRLRIQLKKLRYQLGIVDGQCAQIQPQMAALRRQSRRLQNVLGRHQDAHFARDRVQRHITDHEVAAGSQLHVFVELQTQTAQLQRRVFARAWEQFLEAANAFTQQAQKLQTQAAGAAG